jgi:hypothetical protein
MQLQRLMQLRHLMAVPLAMPAVRLPVTPGRLERATVQLRVPVTQVRLEARTLAERRILMQGPPERATAQQRAPVTQERPAAPMPAARRVLTQGRQERTAEPRAARMRRTLGTARLTRLQGARWLCAAADRPASGPTGRCVPSTAAECKSRTVCTAAPELLACTTELEW